MKKNSPFSYQKGFISAATVVLMITSLGVIMTLLYRSTQGTLIASRLKQSNQAYQDGDGAAERILTEIRSLENSPTLVRGIDSRNKIPQNIRARDFCVDPVICYNSSGAKISAGDNTTMLSDVTRVGARQMEGQATRALQASVPQRVSVPATALVGTVSGRRVTIQWFPSVNTLPSYDQIEVRRALIGTRPAGTFNELTNLLKDTTLNWTIVGNRQAITATQIVDNGVPSGTYAYSMKITNKNPLMLDSSYILPVRVIVP